MIDCSATEMAATAIAFENPRIRLIVSVVEGSGDFSSNEKLNHLENSVIHDFIKLINSTTVLELSEIRNNYNMKYQEQKEWLEYLETRWMKYTERWWFDNRVVSQRFYGFILLWQCSYISGYVKD